MQFTTPRKSTAAWCPTAVWVVWALLLRSQLLVMAPAPLFGFVGLLAALPARAMLLPGLRLERAGYLTRRPWPDRAA